MDWTENNKSDLNDLYNEPTNPIVRERFASVETNGLTKLEWVSTTLLAGMLSNNSNIFDDFMIRDTVEKAKELLKQCNS